MLPAKLLRLIFTTLKPVSVRAGKTPRCVPPMQGPDTIWFSDQPGDSELGFDLKSITARKDNYRVTTDSR